MSTILVVEDNKDVNLMLAEAIRNAGFEVDSAFNGIEGLQYFKSRSYDLILLDIMLPYKSGDEVLREIRESSMIPVIIISAKDMVTTKIDLLRLGADDYITKPFDLGEVIARVETALRRVNVLKQKEQNILYKDLSLRCADKRLFVNGSEIELTAKEYLIMELLMTNKDKIFTKANLYETIWGEEYIGDDNTIKTHMSNLRNKLKFANQKEEYIETVWGLGYRLFKE